MLVATIVMIQFMGVSYGAWTDEVNINTSISMGSIDTYFSEAKISNKVNKESKKNTLKINKEGNTLYIEGTVEPGYKGTIDYEISNKGTIPVESKDGKTIKPDDKEVLPGRIKIEPKLNKNQNENSYTYEVNEELIFKLPNSNKDNKSWQDKLVIKGKIKVEKSKEKVKENQQKLTQEET